MSDSSAGAAENLEALPTEQLRHRAFSLAEHRRDVGFFWDLIRHLPQSSDVSTEDGSAGGIGGSIVEVIGVLRQLSGHGYGEAEPLLRAKFVDYLTAHPSGGG